MLERIAIAFISGVILYKQKFGQKIGQVLANLGWIFNVGTDILFEKAGSCTLRGSRLSLT